MALPGEGIIPIYAERYPPFEADPVEPESQAWIKDLRRRWCIDWLALWPDLPELFHQEKPWRTLAGLPRQISERLHRASRVPPHPARCLHPALASSVVTPSCI